MTAKTDYSKMTGPELVAAYNAMVDHGVKLGMPSALWRHVNKFSSSDVGRTRCAKLEVAIDGAGLGEQPTSDIATNVAEASADANRDLRPRHLVENEKTHQAIPQVSAGGANKKAPATDKKKSHSAGDPADFRQVRAGTVRAAVVEAASKSGATLDSVGRTAHVDRKKVLAHLHCLRRDCAIGYELDGEVVRLIFPKGKTAADAIKAATEKK